jgi:hypothetical protein
MKNNTLTNISKLLICWACLSPRSSVPQMPGQLPVGRLHITSTTTGASITINGTKRNEVTPVTLAVLPNTYKVVIGACPAQSVTVASGQTIEVTCNK